MSQNFFSASPGVYSLQAGRGLSQAFQWRKRPISTLVWGVTNCLRLTRECPRVSLKDISRKWILQKGDHGVTYPPHLEPTPPPIFFCDFVDLDSQMSSWSPFVLRKLSFLLALAFSFWRTEFAHCHFKKRGILKLNHKSTSFHIIVSCLARQPERDHFSAVME